MFPPFHDLEHFRVDLAAERQFGRMEAPGNIPEAHGPDNHHVISLPATCVPRAIDP